MKNNLSNCLHLSLTIFIHSLIHSNIHSFAKTPTMRYASQGLYTEPNMIPSIIELYSHNILFPFLGTPVEDGLLFKYNIQWELIGGNQTKCGESERLLE